MYIDNTYFRGELKVPNSQDYPNSHLDGNKVTLESFISEYEIELMRLALGNATYSDFKDQFENDGTLKPAADQKWKDFVNGEEYTLDGETYLWKGLRYTEGVFKKSLIADYVYCKYLDFYSTSFNGVGMGVENPANASRISSIPRIVDIWNKFLYKYQDNPNGSSSRIWSTSRGLTVGIDWATDRSDYFVSMDRYLTDKEADFPNRKVFYFEGKNSFGI